MHVYVDKQKRRGFWGNHVVPPKGWKIMANMRRAKSQSACPQALPESFSLCQQYRDRARDRKNCYLQRRLRHTYGKRRERLFYPEFARHLRPEPKAAQVFQDFLDSPERVVIELHQTTNCRLIAQSCGHVHLKQPATKMIHEIRRKSD